jgi:hypothetical protein
MSVSATGYLFVATSITATTTATSIGGYTVPAGTRGQIIAVTISNMATTNLTNYVDTFIYSNTASASYGIGGRKTPVYPGGSFVVVGAEKHVLPTGGAFQVTTYATGQVDVAMTIVEVS